MSARRRHDDRWMSVPSSDAAGHMEVPSVVCLPLSIERLLRLLEACLGGYSTNELSPDGQQGAAPRGEA